MEQKSTLTNRLKMNRLSKGLLLLFVALSLSGCARHVNEIEKTQWMKKVDTEEVSRLVITYSNELKHTHHLYLEDASVVFHENLEKLLVSYITQDILELSEARELLVEVTEGILDRINAHPKLAGELAYFPLRPQDLKVNIICESFNNEYVDSKYINWILLEDGEAFYYDASLQNRSSDVMYLRREPYCKSLQFVKFGKEAEEIWKLEHPTKKKLQDLLTEEIPSEE